MLSSKLPHDHMSEFLFNSRSMCYSFSITNHAILGDVTMQDEACVTNMVNIKRNEAEMANPRERFLLHLKSTMSHVFFSIGFGHSASNRTWPYFYIRRYNEQRRRWDFFARGIIIINFIQCVCILADCLWLSLIFYGSVLLLIFYEEMLEKILFPVCNNTGRQ